MSGATAISDADVLRIADLVAAIVLAKIQGVATAAPKVAVTIDELQVMLGCPSKWSTHQEIKRLGLKAYSRGKYRLRDVEHAIARRTRE